MMSSVRHVNQGEVTKITKAEVKLIMQRHFFSFIAFIV